MRGYDQGYRDNSDSMIKENADRSAVGYGEN